MAAKPNLWPFSKRKSAPRAKSVRRSSMTVGAATRAAFKAGQESGDTGLFESWLRSKGLEGRGNVLQSRLRKEYERGVIQGETPAARAKTPDDKNREFLARISTPKATSYKGRKIEPRGDAWVIPSIDRESEFDSLADAKRFLDSWGKANPVTDRAQARNPGGRMEYALMEAPRGGQAREIARYKAEYKDQAEQHARDLQSHYSTTGTRYYLKKVRLSKRNPASSAAALYESFHGKPADQELIIEEQEHEHENLAVIGCAVDCWIETPTGLLAHIEFDEDSNEPVIVTSAEDGKQLYFTGGDQAVDLASLKMEGDEWVRDRMVLGRFAEPHCKCGGVFEKRGEKYTCEKCGRKVTFDTKDPKDQLHNLGYRTRKDFDKFQDITYEHDLGEETGERPILEFTPRVPHLYIAGGQYFIEQPLFETSPGIEN